jgi:pimeloyl-ACP methyl ester carboxylesterase
MSNELHHVEYGNGTPLVFIHGYNVDHHLLRPFESVFADHSGWRRIYLDLPGHGRTPADVSAPTADAIADVVADTIERLVGSGPFAVCGNSFGGQLSREMVARFGDRVLGVALISPVVVPQAARRRGIHRIFRGAEPEADLAAADPATVAEFTSIAVEHSASAWAAFTRYVAPGLAAYDRDFARRLLESFELSVRPEERFGTFDRPSLVLTGRQDQGVGYLDQFELLASYPRMTYVALDRAGHNVHLDQPDVSRALFGDWLRRMA